MPDFGGATAEIESFRAKARDWIENHYPASLKGKSGYMAGDPDVAAADPDFERWRKAMGDKGWGVPTWPKEYGGGGLSREEAKVLSQEMAAAGAWNPIGGMGVAMFGPTLLEYGTEEQKRKYIPAIAKAETRWCQGFSEPGAGSDLASLQTKAEDKGDHFLVNGQKIWTSGAQYADMCFCLVRTDPNNKHEGISFVLIDMKDPGVRVRPILLISGVSPFCETFFTDVKVPKENLVGKLNHGWGIAKRLLQHERQGIGGNSGRAEQVNMAKLAETYIGRDDHGRIDDPDLRQRLINHASKAKAFALTMARTVAEAKANAGPSAASSILKNAGSTIGQERHELTLEVMGHQGLGWEGEAFDKKELDAVRQWLGGKAFTIYGGSQEIQNNIIAKRILGLLDHQ